MAEDIRTRFAPSPTGPLHLGSARTALFNYLFSKKHDGKFVLRIEDTDKTRSKEEFEFDIENGLLWLGLNWDEGPVNNDPYGPYKQSERGKIYKKYIDQLLESKKAYYCYCSEEELEAERKKQEAKHLPPKYSGKCRSVSEKEIEKYKAEGRKPTIRFRVDSSDGGEKIKFNDLIHGKMEFDPKLIGDFIIVKADNEPVFLLSNIIDDAEMEISHVIRGDDHLSNTPKQLMLADALNLPYPEYGHLPLILNPDRTKLSKRKNPTSVTKDFRDEGYLPEALINFLIFLGWSPKTEKEFFTLDELIYEFDLSEVNTSPAIFDQDKLDYLNGYYIRTLSLGKLAQLCFPYFVKAGLVKKESEKILSAVSLVQERMKKLCEAPELTEFLFKKPTYDKDLLIAKKSDKETTLKALQCAYDSLKDESDFGRDSTENLLRDIASSNQIDAGKLLWPCRVALSGRNASPGVFELLEVMGKEESLARIKTAVDMLK